MGEAIGIEVVALHHCERGEACLPLGQPPGDLLECPWEVQKMGAAAIELGFRLTEGVSGNRRALFPSVSA